MPSFVTESIGRAIGTLLYLDPEASTRKENNAFTEQQLEELDLYALGVTLYALFTVNRGIYEAQQLAVLDQIRWRPIDDETLFGNDIVQALTNVDVKKRLSARKWHVEVLARLKKLGPIEQK